MAYWLYTSTIAFFLSILCAGILIPQILLVSFRRDLFDEPDDRKIHRGIVPRLGGIAFTPVICFSVALILGIEYFCDDIRMELLMLQNAQAVSFSFCALLLLYITGIADDLVGIRYQAKFAIQVICAILLIMGGMWITDLHGLFWIREIPAWIGIPLTVALIVFIINTVSIIDGIDGLASGLSAVAFIIYGLVFGLIGKPVYAMISFAALGVLVPFFYFNVFGNPSKKKKIFMGDTGTLTIGLFLAFLSLELLHYSPYLIPELGTNPIIVAFSPLIIPVFDVIRVFIYRIIHHGNPFMPDRTHIHHKLMAIGIRPRVAMIAIVIGSIFFILFNIALSSVLNVTLIILIDIVLWLAINRAITLRIKRNQALAEDN